jgi:hypothetical protein
MKKKSIDEHEFKQLCANVEHDSAAILRDRGGLTGDTAMQHELFARLCHALGIEMESAQATDLLEGETGYSFAIMQTLEENMHPAFLYIDTLGPFLKRVGAMP